MKPKELSDAFERLRTEIRAFPAGYGLYFMKDAAGTVLYIGKAKNLRNRVSSYFQPAADILTSRGPGIAEMLTKVRSVDFLETKSEVDALLTEARLIKDIRPPYNTDMTDDKTFPYLEITTGDFPGIYITRKPRKRSRLFGPFTSAKDLLAGLTVLQKIFKFRTCSLEISDKDDKKRFFRPCLLYSIKQCTAPCANRITKADYKKLINDLVKFLSSKRSKYLKKLAREMETAATATDYEAAAMIRDRIRLIKKLDERGSVGENVQPEVFASAADPAEAMDKLGKILKTDSPLRIIEGFDIAHINGSETVGSLVRFIDGKPFKAGYRRYKIKTVSGIDDCACIKEVLLRRYRNAAEARELWPDVVLIDGGKGQLSAAEKAFEQLEVEVPLLMSIAKKEEIVYVSGKDSPIKLPASSPVRKLLQYVRDEAHRFAQHYHHILRKKKLLGK
ncbi:MAG: excinuclease ABC subunit UvrC [Anaerohalosphaeraceae bacterium]|nr:excinuclease ABC subunit UvrC [Anaerohalosphaeraceae bacterium]